MGTQTLNINEVVFCSICTVIRKVADDVTSQVVLEIYLMFMNKKGLSI